MERMREGSEQLRDQIQAAREEAIRILIAEPFDGTAYDRQVSKIHELHGQRSQRMAEIVKEVAKDLPPEGGKPCLSVVGRPRPAPN